MRTRRIASSSDPMPSQYRNGTSIFLNPDTDKKNWSHRSVLLHEAIANLNIKPDDCVVDATLGGACHARALCDALDERGVFVGFDLDHDAIVRAQEALIGVRPRVHLIEGNFRNMASECTARGIEHIDKALFDLGWSSYQLYSGRGFSFTSDEPLLMTYSTKDEGILTANEIVNDWEESSLADIIFGWGEERYSRRIARAIVEQRSSAPIVTARQLAEIIYTAVPRAYAHGRIHPATKTFQALRIAVNDEMGALKEGVNSAWGMLNSGGRIAIISFHSIEDRIVKQQLLSYEKDGSGVRITRKPLVVSSEEIARNPRARSAKLRVIEKQNTDTL